jgi:hypothetical protein
MINLLGIPIRDAMRADSWILLQEVGYHEKSEKVEADPGSSPGYPQWGNVPTLEVSDSYRII